MLGIKAPPRQGAKTLEYMDIPVFRTSSRTECFGDKK